MAIAASPIQIRLLRRNRIGCDHEDVAKPDESQQLRPNTGPKEAMETEIRQIKPEDYEVLFGAGALMRELALDQAMIAKILSDTSVAIPIPVSSPTIVAGSSVRYWPGTTVGVVTSITCLCCQSTAAVAWGAHWWSGAWRR